MLGHVVYIVPDILIITSLNRIKNAPFNNHLTARTVHQLAAENNNNNNNNLM